MLIHICCSVDSHYFLSELKKQYPNEVLIGFFYNPNIHPKEEYTLRLNDVRRSCKLLDIELLEGEYDLFEWFDQVRGLEDEPEKGERCIKCFNIRLVRSALESQKHNEKRFTTTLLASPMKEQKRLFFEGDRIAQYFGLEFVKIDVRSNGGVQRQNALAKKDCLYRQNYCGCYFALIQQRKRQDKISLESLSDISGQNPLGSIGERMQTFKIRDDLERDEIPYILTQKQFRVHRVLKSLLEDKDKIPIFHHVLTQSHSKKYSKIQTIKWVKPLLLEIHGTSRQKYLDGDFRVGFSDSDSTQFILLDFVNLILQKNLKHLSDLRQNPLSLREELELRRIISGDLSQNPILILEERVSQDIFLEIECIFQEENIFRVVPIQ